MALKRSDGENQAILKQFALEIVGVAMIGLVIGLLVSHIDEIPVVFLALGFPVFIIAGVLLLAYLNLRKPPR